MKKRNRRSAKLDLMFLTEKNMVNFTSPKTRIERRQVTVLDVKTANFNKLKG